METLKLSSSDFLLGWSIIDRWPQLLSLRMPHFPQVVPRHGIPLQATLPRGLPISLAKPFVEMYRSPRLSAQTSFPGAGLLGLPEGSP